MKSGILPKKWTNAKVRVNGSGKVQVMIPASSARKNPGRRKNESVEMGFYRGGKFHPIRASDDYDPGAVGERSQYATRRTARRRRR